MATLDPLLNITEAERDLFLEETNEHLETLETGLLKLEEGSAPAAVLNEIFRSAHTIKGSAATLGLEDMTSLTHLMESWFDRFRAGSRPTPDIVDALLKATDILKTMATGLAGGACGDVDVAPVLALLTTGLQAGAERPTGEDGPAVAAKRTVGTTGSNWQVTALIEDQCPMPAVRALQLLLALDEVGEVAGSIPDRSDIESERVQRQVTVWLASDLEREEIIRAVSSVPEIVRSEVEAVRPETGVETGDRQQAGETRQAETGTVRINVAILDDLMNLVGELVIGRGRLSSIGEQLAGRRGAEDLSEELARLSTQLARVTGSIQDAVLKARMLPLTRVFQRLPRLVRDLSRQQGKSVELVIRGEDTELDRSIHELLGDPLTHLVRNSIDHGIELPDERERKGKSRGGLIEIRANHEESRVVISLTDDGRGLDAALLRKIAVKRGLLTKGAADELSDSETCELIFSPGFSTSEQVTEVSGRGVGMDVVKRNVEQAGGRIEIDTIPGRSTTIRLVLPLTLATLRVLLVNAGGHTLAAPLSTVQETLHVPTEAIRPINKRPHTLVRDSLVPLIWLEDLYSPNPDWQSRVNGQLTVVLARHNAGVAGIVVDGLLGEREVVIKRLGEAVGNVPGIGGATILGDGGVALILDVPGMVRALSARG